MSTPDTTSRDQDWVPRTRELLDHHAERLDPADARRLVQARRHALAAVRRPGLRQWSLGLSAAAAASLVLFVVLNRTPEQPVEPLTSIEAPAQTTPTPIEQALKLSDDELDLIADPDEYALLQELEFYAWLESAENGG